MSGQIFLHCRGGRTLWVPSHVAAPHETNPVVMLSAIQAAELTRSFYLFDQEIQLVDHPQLCAVVPNGKTVQDVQQAVHKFRTLCKDNQNYLLSQCYDPRKEYPPANSTPQQNNSLMMPSSLLNTAPGQHQNNTTTYMPPPQHHQQAGMMGMNNSNNNTNIPPNSVLTNNPNMNNVNVNEMLLQFMQQQQKQQQQQQQQQQARDMPNIPMMPQNLYTPGKDSYGGGVNRAVPPQSSVSGMPPNNYPPGPHQLPSPSGGPTGYMPTGSIPNAVSPSTYGHHAAGMMPYAGASSNPPSSVMGSGSFNASSAPLPISPQPTHPPFAAPHSSNMMMPSGYPNSMNNSLHSNGMPPPSLSMPSPGFDLQQPQMPFFPGNNVMMGGAPMMNPRSYSRQNQGNQQNNGMYPLPGMPSKEKPGFTEENIRRSPEPIDDLIKGIDIPRDVLDAYNNPTQKLVCATMPGARMTVWLREHEIPPDAMTAKAKYVFCQGGIVLMLKAHGTDVKESKPVELFPKQICTHFLIHNYCSRENCLHEHHNEQQLRHLIAARHVQQKALSKKKRHELISGILELEAQNLAKFAEEKAARQMEKEAARRNNNNNNNNNINGNNSNNNRNSNQNNPAAQFKPKSPPVPVKLDMGSDEEEDEEEREKVKKIRSTSKNSNNNNNINNKGVPGKRNFVVGVADDDDDDGDDDSSSSSSSDDDEAPKKSGASKFETALEEDERSDSEDILKRRARSESSSASSSSESSSRSSSPPPEKRIKTENAKEEPKKTTTTTTDGSAEESEEAAAPDTKEEKKKKAPAKKNAASKTSAPSKTDEIPQKEETEAEEKKTKVEEEGADAEKAAPKKRGRKPGTTAKKAKK